MKSSRTMAFALTCGVVIFATSLGVAYVLFGILESSASADLREWKLGGAFAGFAFAALLLSSTVFQVFKEVRRDKEEDYLRQIQELQSKLIRGAPVPPRYAVDVDEQHKLIFARPGHWKRLGGLLYQYVSPPGARVDFSANFNVVFETPDDLERHYGIAGGSLQGDPLSEAELEALYKKTIQAMLAGLPKGIPGYQQHAFSQEYVFVDGLKSARYTHTYSRTFEVQAQGGGPGAVEGSTQTIPMTLTQVGVVIFHPRLRGMFTFTFTDDGDDFLDSSEEFNRILSSVRFME